MAPPPPPPGPIDVQVLPETDTSTFTIPDRLTIQSVAKRRAASGKLVAGVAAWAEIDVFKGKGHGIKPLAKRWDDRLTHETKNRGGSSLKNAARYLMTPGIISLGGGLPSSEYFPFHEIDVKIPKLDEINNPDAFDMIRAGKHDMALEKSALDISTALNYGQGHGSAQLLRWIVEHTEIVHNPPYRDWSCTMSVGSTSAWDFVLRMLTRPGEWVLSEQYTFPAAVETAAPMGVKVAAVAMDECGMLATSLDEVVTNWDEKTRGGPKPLLIYTVPTGQNPTGSTQSAERRREIYKVAQKHDLIIFEDEPYYFLQMAPYTGPNAPNPGPPASHEEFLRSIVPSYLSMDTEGRVIRADSFSKVLAPGTRVGWITASEQICERYRTHADVCTQGPSGISQLIIFKLLDENWGHAGYLDWLIHIRMSYTERRDVMMESCERHLPKTVVRWVPPMAGMFHWLEIDYKKHPHYPQKSLDELEEEIFQTIIKHGTLLMKGAWFCAERSDDVRRDAMFFRATYAAAQFDKIDEAIRRFGNAIRDSFGMENETNGTHA